MGRAGTRDVRSSVVVFVPSEDVLQKVIHKARGGVVAREVEGPAVGRQGAANADALFRDGKADRATGLEIGGGRRVGEVLFELDQEGLDGAPLLLGAFGLDLTDVAADRLAPAFADGSGQADHLADGQGLGAFHDALKIAVDDGKGAQARAFGGVGSGVEGGDGVVDGGEDAVGDAFDDQVALVPRRNGGVEFVFLDHQTEGLGHGGEGADQRGDRRELAGDEVGVEVFERGVAAHAGDDGIGLAGLAFFVGGIGEGEDFDRLAETMLEDREAEFLVVGLVEIGAVAGDAEGDGGQGDLVDGVGHGGPRGFRRV